MGKGNSSGIGIMPIDVICGGFNGAINEFKIYPDIFKLRPVLPIESETRIQVSLRAC